MVQIFLNENPNGVCCSIWDLAIVLLLAVAANTALIFALKKAMDTELEVSENED